jgi:hypothetical protein
MPDGDQDREWVACFYVSASNEDTAKSWGDIVANSYCSRHTDMRFLSSYIDRSSAPWPDNTPTVAYGEMPSDDQIGW